MMSVSLRWSFLSLSLLGCAVATEGPALEVIEGSGTGGGSASGGAVGTGGTAGVGGVPVGSTGGAFGTGGVAPGAGGAVAGTGGVVGGTGGAATAVSFTRDAEGRFVGSPATAAGYGFAYIAGATQTDLPAPLDAATQICGSGSVPISADYSYVAGIGWNVNQAGGEGTAASPYPATVSSLTVTYANNGGSPLRVQASNGTTHWCYTLPAGAGGTVTIPAAQFNTACWNASGSAWNGTGLASVQLIVPSTNAAATTFNACLSGVRVN